MPDKPKLIKIGLVEPQLKVLFMDDYLKTLSAEQLEGLIKKGINE